MVILRLPHSKPPYGMSNRWFDILHKRVAGSQRIKLHILNERATHNHTLALYLSDYRVSFMTHYDKDDSVGFICAVKKTFVRHIESGQGNWNWCV